MARKKPQRRVPVVPRGVVPATSSELPNGATVATPRAYMGPASLTVEEEFGHVRRDLLRIVTFGGLIVAGMIALKFVGI